MIDDLVELKDYVLISLCTAIILILFNTYLFIHRYGKD